MKAIKLQTRVSEDRTLRLRLPDDVAEGPADVVVLIAGPGRALPEFLAEGTTLTRHLWSRAEIEHCLRGDDLLRRLVENLRAALGDDLRELILFGSRARGDHRPGSDYDCLAIVDQVTEELEDAIREVTADLLGEGDGLVSVRPIAEERFRNEMSNPLFENVRREGVTLWKTSAA